jgi:hypothetical protein
VPAAGGGERAAPVAGAGVAAVIFPRVAA